MRLVTKRAWTVAAAEGARDAETLLDAGANLVLQQVETELRISWREGRELCSRQVFYAEAAGCDNRPEELACYDRSGETICHIAPE